MKLQHLACIMDGNRRWAMRQGFAALLGHKKGIEAIDIVTDFCLVQQISYLSLYTYSIENLQNRSSHEQNYLFGQLAHEALDNIDSFKRKGVCIKFLGNRALFPEIIQPVCEKVEAETADGTALQLNLLLCYGGRQEIVKAAQCIAQQVIAGTVKVEDITPELLENNLWTAGIPSPDLIIRTGAQQRLSNFLLYQAAYSELYFLDCMWPDISSIELESALTYYHECRKNFGK